MSLGQLKSFNFIFDRKVAFVRNAQRLIIFFFFAIFLFSETFAVALGVFRAFDRI